MAATDHLRKDICRFTRITAVVLGPTNSPKESLPEQAQAYVQFIEGHCGVSIAWIGTGPNREDMISRPISIVI